MTALYPSLIAADQLNLQQAVLLLQDQCNGFHCDVMDNHFVPNLTWGPPTIGSLNALSSKPLWVHLMVDNPYQILDALELKPDSLISFHLESTNEAGRVIDRIREKKWRPSLAISPKTQPESTFDLLPAINQVLVMSVEPGAGGQLFLPDALGKIKKLVSRRTELGLNFTIGVDGGITAQNIAAVCQAGGQDLVVGTAVFGSDDPVTSLAHLYEQCQ